jgi:hypothetical protein
MTPRWQGLGSERSVGVDDKRFDALSRVLGRGASRRGALGTLAGLAGLLGVETVAAKRSGKRQRARVQAERMTISPCAQLCLIIFPGMRRRQRTCFGNCECVRRCLDLPEPDQQTACMTAAITDPRLCRRAEETK